MAAPLYRHVGTRSTIPCEGKPQLVTVVVLVWEASFLKRPKRGLGRGLTVFAGVACLNPVPGVCGRVRHGMISYGMIPVMELSGLMVVELMVSPWLPGVEAS